MDGLNTNEGKIMNRQSLSRECQQALQLWIEQHCPCPLPNKMVLPSLLRIVEDEVKRAREAEGIVDKLWADIREISGWLCAGPDPREWPIFRLEFAILATRRLITLLEIALQQQDQEEEAWRKDTIDQARTAWALNVNKALSP